MYNRQITPILQQSLKKYSVLTLIGPRQSGKTTITRNNFPDYSYTSLEDPDKRAFALSDPRAFIKSVGDRAILDEIQRVPELASYLQGIVDEPGNNNKYILTGSNGLLVSDTVTQTLAGRTELFELLPLSYAELIQKNSSISLQELLFKGGYPRIYNMDLDPTSWLKSYFQLYVEKDVRLVTNITSLDRFENFVRLVAGRVGQLVNASNLANEVGVSSPTVTSWISALKATYICFTLKPHYKNFNKRIVKSPKLYFYDTGLLCYLLGINNIDQLATHPLRGNIFENFVVSEFFKNKCNRGEPNQYYFWRDQKGHEIDLIEDRSTHLFPIEIKMSETFNAEFIKNIVYLNELQEDELSKINLKGNVIYSGDMENMFKDIEIKNWKSLGALS